MKNHTTPPDDSWESDDVWELLQKAPPASPSKRFVENTLRAVRLSERQESWWTRLSSPTRLFGMSTGLVGATAAVMLSVHLWTPVETSTGVHVDSAKALAIQDLAENETLLAAVEHMDDFSDGELVSLIGF